MQLCPFCWHFISSIPFCEWSPSENILWGGSSRVTAVTGWELQSCCGSSNAGKSFPAQALLLGALRRRHPACCENLPSLLSLSGPLACQLSCLTHCKLGEFPFHEILWQTEAFLSTKEWTRDLLQAENWSECTFIPYCTAHHSSLLCLNHFIFCVPWQHSILLAHRYYKLRFFFSISQFSLKLLLWAHSRFICSL